MAQINNSEIICREKPTTKRLFAAKRNISARATIAQAKLVLGLKTSGIGRVSQVSADNPNIAIRLYLEAKTFHLGALKSHSIQYWP